MTFWKEGVRGEDGEHTASRGTTGDKQVMKKSIARQLCGLLRAETHTDGCMSFC